MPGTQIGDGIYFELGFADLDGIDQGQRKTEAALNAMDRAAERTGEKFDTLKAKMKSVPSQVSDADVQAAAKRFDAMFPSKEKAKQSGAQIARSLLEGVTAEYNTRRAEIQLALSRGLIDKKTAEREGREAAQAFNAGVRSTIDKASLSGALDGPKGADTLTALAGRLKNVDVAGKSASVSLASLRQPLTTLAAQSLSVNTNVGRVATTLLSLGVGGSAMLLIVGGLAAIAKGWDLITSGARKARKEAEEFSNRMLALAETQKRAGDAGAKADLIKANEAKAAAEDRLARAERRSRELLLVGPGDDSFSITASVMASRELSAARRELKSATTSQTAAEKEYVKAVLETQAATARTLGALLLSEKATPHDRSHAAEMLKDLRAELHGLGSEMPQRRAELQALIETLTAADRAAAGRGVKEETREGRVSGVMEQLEAIKVSLTPATSDNLTQRLAALERSLKELKPEPEEIAAFKALKEQIEGLAAAATAEDLGRQMRDLISSSTPTLVDDMTDRLTDLKAALVARGASQEFIDQVTAIQQAMIDARGKTEDLDKQIEQLKKNLASGFNLQGDLAAIRDDLDRDGGLIDQRNAAQAEADATTDRTPERAAAMAKVASLQARINALIEIETQLRARIKALEDGSVTRATTIAGKAAEITNNIEKAANAGFGLASVLLGVDHNITRALGSLGQLAGGLNDISKLADTAKGFGNLFSSPQGIISALPGIGQAIGGAMALAGSLFGKDPQVERARQETLAGMKELRSALIELKDVYLQDVSSTNVAKDIAMAERILKGVGTGAFGEMTFAGNRVLGSGVGNGPGRRGNLRDIGRSIGQDFDSGALLSYFKQLDARYGTNLASFIEREDPYGLLQALRDVPSALQAELGELGRFADDAAGTIAKVNFGLDLLGKSNAGERFRAIVKGLVDAGIGMGEFADEFAELADPTTTAKRVEEIVAAVLDRLNAGGADFGDLTPEELRDLFKQGVDASREGLAGTGGFNVSRSITETTGNRLEAMLSTGNIFLEQIARNTAAMAGGLGVSVSGSPLPPPPILGGVSGAAIEVTGSILRIDSLTVAVGEVGDRAHALAMGHHVSDAMMVEIETRLARVLESGSNTGGGSRTSVLEAVDRGMSQRLRFAKHARGRLL